jgi:hypothetical protein
MKEKRPPYPLIRCKDHPGDPLPGYVVCVHAVNDPSVKLAPIERATAKRLGVVVCVDCAAHEDVPVDKLTTACAHAVQERFGVPL